MAGGVFMWRNSCDLRTNSTEGAMLKWYPFGNVTALDLVLSISLCALENLLAVRLSTNRLADIGQFLGSHLVRALACLEYIDCHK